jgi:hypothetical protein
LKNILILALAFLLNPALYSQEPHMLKVFFRYGSIPEIGYEYIEYEEVGGLQGGHVSLGIDSLEIGFTNVDRIHVFPNRKAPTGIFYWEYLKDFENGVADKKYVTFLIPISEEQYKKLTGLLLGYLDDPPYDYAFFGMRCASATYEVLSQIGILEQKSRVGNIISNFYPRMLRRKMAELARKNGYTVIRVKGRKTRIWERDDP